MHLQELLSEAPEQLATLLDYPLESTLASNDAKQFIDDNLKEVGIPLVAQLNMDPVANQ